MSESMTNDEAQEWLLSMLNRLPDAASHAGTFGAAIRAIRAKAIADAKEWAAEAAVPPEGLDVERAELHRRYLATTDPEERDRLWSLIRWNDRRADARAACRRDTGEGEKP